MGVLANKIRIFQLGFRNLIRAGESGIVYDFFIYDGKNKKYFLQDINYSTTNKLLKSLCKNGTYCNRQC